MRSIDNSSAEAINPSKETSWRDYLVLFNRECPDCGQAMEFLRNSKEKTVVFCHLDSEKLLLGKRPREELPLRICCRVELYFVESFPSYDRLELLEFWADGSVSGIQVAIGGCD